MSRQPHLDRRTVLATVGVGATTGLSGCGWRRNTVDWEEAETTTISFDEGWPESWLTDGVGNLTEEAGSGRLEAGTDIYPAKHRATAFRPDSRAVDSRVQATVSDTSVGSGVVLRRVGPHTAYAGVLDTDRGSFDLVVMEGYDEQVLASRSVGLPVGETELELAAVGTNPTTLHGALHATDSGTLATVSTTDGTTTLQKPGDQGVLSTAETGLTPEPDPTPGALEQFRLLGVADGSIRYIDIERPENLSTTVFEEMELATRTESRPTMASVVAASARRPTDDGFAVRVVADAPATVAVETAPTNSFADTTRTELGDTNEFRTALGTVPAPAGATIYWRPVLERGGGTTQGASRQVSVPPARGSGGDQTFSMVVGACATRFTKTFQEIDALDPDVLVWEGDINYPDAMGPVAQTMSGYAGLWKALIRTRELDGLLSSTCIAFSRDDHDYGLNDVASDNLKPYGIEPFEQVMEPEPYFRFSGGPIDAWVLDTRKWRDPHEKEDTLDKTLLGDEQLTWLTDGLVASDAPFKVVCSPGPLFNVPNDSYSWARGYTAERDHVLSIIDEEVDGEVVFVTGDTHSGCVTRDRGVLEVRAAPLEMPGPAFHSASSGDSVRFSDTGNYFSYIEARGSGTDATLDVSLRHSNGEIAWETQLSSANE